MSLEHMTRATHRGLAAGLLTLMTITVPATLLATGVEEESFAADHSGADSETPSWGLANPVTLNEEGTDADPQELDSDQASAKVPDTILPEPPFEVEIDVSASAGRPSRWDSEKEHPIRHAGRFGLGVLRFLQYAGRTLEEPQRR